MKNQIRSLSQIPLGRWAPSCSAWGNGFLLIPLALVGVFASPPPARANCENGCDFNNTYLGEGALANYTTGGANTAVGYLALYNNTAGYGNTAFGNDTLVSNTIAIFNTAAGSGALAYNTTGSYNTADGAGALYLNTNGLNNTAAGFEALHGNTTGDSNTASGYHALYSNTTGSSNIAIGESAGINLTTGSNNIDIGARGVAGESNKIRVGKQGTHNGTFIAGISGVAVMGSQVVVNPSGKLGVAASSKRFKEEIRLMDEASEALLALKPVMFHYKKELDPDGTAQFGLVAEDVEKVNPDLVVRDEEGNVMSVRYDAVNVMLLNEFLKEHKKVEEQQATIAELKKAIARLAVKDEERAAQIQKVSAQIELSKASPRTVLNDQ
jgi:Chaperone of endosialidase